MKKEAFQANYDYTDRMNVAALIAKNTIPISDIANNVKAAHGGEYPNWWYKVRVEPSIVADQARQKMAAEKARQKLA